MKAILGIAAILSSIYFVAGTTHGIADKGLTSASNVRAATLAKAERLAMGE